MDNRSSAQQWLAVHASKESLEQAGDRPRTTPMLHSANTWLVAHGLKPLKPAPPTSAPERKVP